MTGLFTVVGLCHLHAQEFTTNPSDESMYLTVEGKKYTGAIGENFFGNVFLNLNRSDDNDQSLISFNRNANQLQIGTPASRWEFGLIAGEDLGIFNYNASENPARDPALTFQVQNSYASFGSPDYLARVSILNNRAGAQGLNVRASGHGMYGESMGTGSQAGYGVWGKSLEKNGIFGESQQAHAIYGRLISAGNDGSGLAGVRGLATEKNNYGISGYNVNGIGVHGESVDSAGVFGKGSYGVIGIGQGEYSSGVFGAASNVGSTGLRGFGGVGVSGSGITTGVSAFSYLGTGLIASTFEGQYAGRFNGDVFTTGVYLPSDRALKENILPLNNALLLILQLDPKSYHFRDKKKTGTQSGPELAFGLIAQDLEKVLPQLIKETDLVDIDEHGVPKETTDKIKAINYLELIPILIGGMQEQQEMIAKMQKQIMILENQINSIVDEK